MRPGDAILLEGDLGAGKSHLARSLIRARTGDAALDVPSPTFTLVQTYDAGEVEIWHADLYRLSGPWEVDETGLFDAFETAICLVEWPDRLGADAPDGALTLSLHISGPDSRTVEARGPARWVPVFEALEKNENA